MLSKNNQMSVASGVEAAALTLNQNENPTESPLSWRYLDELLC